MAAGLALLWTVFALLAQFSGALDEFEETILDHFQSLAAWPEPPSNQLALVAIDSIPDDRPWPWSRLDYSLGLRALIDYAPQSVVFNMNLNDRDPSYTSFDDIFSHIVERENAVVFSATGTTSGEERSSAPASLGTIPSEGPRHRIPRFGSAIWPLPTFAGQSPVGINNVQPEENLRLRWIPARLSARPETGPLARAAGHGAIFGRRPRRLGSADRAFHFPAPARRPRAAHHSHRRGGPHARALPARPRRVKLAGEFR